MTYRLNSFFVLVGLVIVVIVMGRNLGELLKGSIVNNRVQHLNFRLMLGSCSERYSKRSKKHEWKMSKSATEFTLTPQLHHHDAYSSDYDNRILQSNIYKGSEISFQGVVAQFTPVVFDVEKLPFT